MLLETQIRELIREEIKAATAKEENYVTVDKAAEFLHYTTHTVYKAVQGKRLPFHKVAGRLLFKLSELQGHVRKIN